MSLLMALGVILLGQDSSRVKPIDLNKIKNTFENNRYAEVIEMVKADLDHFPQQSPDRLETLLKYLALAQASKGLEAEARQSFATLLLIQPGYRFEPGEISPKIKVLFDRVATDSTLKDIKDTFAPAYLIKADRRSALILKSLIFPGWGQQELGEKHGYIWSTLFSVSVIGSGISIYMTHSTQQDYLAAYDPGEIETSYSVYNNWYHIRNSFLAVTLLTYTLNLVDMTVTVR